jgi:hypothetical protein
MNCQRRSEMRERPPCATEKTSGLERVQKHASAGIERRNKIRKVGAIHFDPLAFDPYQGQAVSSRMGGERAF